MIKNNVYCFIHALTKDTINNQLFSDLGLEWFVLAYGTRQSLGNVQWDNFWFSI